MLIRILRNERRVCYNFTCVVMKFFCELCLNVSDSCCAVYDTMKQTEIVNAERFLPL